MNGNARAAPSLHRIQVPHPPSALCDQTGHQQQPPTPDDPGSTPPPGLPRLLHRPVRSPPTAPRPPPDPPSPPVVHAPEASSAEARAGARGGPSRRPRKKKAEAEKTKTKMTREEERRRDQEKRRNCLQRNARTEIVRAGDQLLLRQMAQQQLHQQQQGQMQMGQQMIVHSVQHYGHMMSPGCYASYPGYAPYHHQYPQYYQGPAYAAGPGAYPPPSFPRLPRAADGGGGAADRGASTRNPPRARSASDPDSAKEEAKAADGRAGTAEKEGRRAADRRESEGLEDPLDGARPKDSAAGRDSVAAKNLKSVAGSVGSAPPTTAISSSAASDKNDDFHRLARELASESAGRAVRDAIAEEVEANGERNVANIRDSNRAPSESLDAPPALRDGPERNAAERRSDGRDPKESTRGAASPSVGPNAAASSEGAPCDSAAPAVPSASPGPRAATGRLRGEAEAGELARRAAVPPSDRAAAPRPEAGGGAAEDAADPAAVRPVDGAARRPEGPTGAPETEIGGPVRGAPGVVSDDDAPTSEAPSRGASAGDGAVSRVRRETSAPVAAPSSRPTEAERGEGPPDDDGVYSAEIKDIVQTHQGNKSGASPRDVVSDHLQSSKTKSKSEKNKEISSPEDEDGDWRIMLMKLEAYLQKFGHLNVPTPKKSEKELSQQGWYELFAWVKEQRTRYAKGTLRPDRMQKLSNIGLDLRVNGPKPLHTHTGAKGVNGALSQQKKEKGAAKRSRKSSTPAQKNLMAGSSMQSTNVMPNRQVQQVGQGMPQMQTPYQPNNNMSGQFMSPMMNGQQQQMQHMQPAYQQFGTTMHMQFQNNGTGQFVPMMNPAQQQMHQMGQMPQATLYQQASGMMQFTPNPYMQQANPNFQNMQAPYQQFNSNMQPQTQQMNCQAQMNHQAMPQLSSQQPRGGAASQETGKVQRKATKAQEPQSKPSALAHKSLTKEEEHHAPQHKNKSQSHDDKASSHRLMREEVYELDTEEDMESQSSSENQGKGKSCKRSGKFTQEEDDYCRAAIRDFELGVLDALPGQNICAYLAKKLGCSYIRVTKKYTGLNHLDNFTPISIKGSDEETEMKVEKAREKIANLYKKFQASAEKQAKKRDATSQSSPDNTKEPPPKKKVKAKPFEEQAKLVKAMREKSEAQIEQLRVKNQANAAKAKPAPAPVAQSNAQQQPIPCDPIANMLKQNFQQALQANNVSACWIQQQADNFELLQKAKLCQLQANSHQQPPEEEVCEDVTMQSSVDSEEKDIAAEMLCKIRKGN